MTDNPMPKQADSQDDSWLDEILSRNKAFYFTASKVGNGASQATQIGVSLARTNFDDYLDDDEAKAAILKHQQAAINRAVAEARLAELAPIHQKVQKPKNYDQMDTAQQQVWVIMALGEIGSYLDERVATLTPKESEK